MDVEAVRLVAGRADQRVAGPQDLGDVVAEAEERDRPPEPDRPPAASAPSAAPAPTTTSRASQPGSPDQPPPRLEQRVEPLAAIAQGADERHRRPLVVPAEPLRAPRRARRRSAAGTARDRCRNRPCAPSRRAPSCSISAVRVRSELAMTTRACSGSRARPPDRARWSSRALARRSGRRRPGSVARRRERNGPS